MSRPRSSIPRQRPSNSQPVVLERDDRAPRKFLTLLGNNCLNRLGLHKRRDLNKADNTSVTLPTKKNQLAKVFVQRDQNPLLLHGPPQDALVAGVWR